MTWAEALMLNSDLDVPLDELFLYLMGQIY